MPWDSTFLIRVPITSSDDTTPPSHTIVMSGCSVNSINLSHDGHSITFLAEVGETFTLYETNPTSEPKQVKGQKINWDLSTGDMGWNHGVSNTAAGEGGKVYTTWRKEGEGGIAVMVVGNEDDNKVWTWKELGMEGGCNPCCTHSGRVFVLGDNGGPTGIWEVLVEEGKGIERVKGLEDDHDIMREYITTFTKPIHVLFEGEMGDVHGYYYPPAGNNQGGSEGSDDVPSSPPPPMLVKCHGGPTSRTRTNFRLDVQFWTTRGFAVLDVDYSGSSGYGKTYRRRLNGNWGVIDYKDCLAGVKYCVKKGLADENRVAIDGGSAGGYTTLCALTFQGEGGGFTAGCSKYGIR